MSELLAPPAAADWLVGGGEMGAIIRAKDWSSTPLGPVESWPQSLRSAVSILLPSRAQICLFWGPDLVTIYNDAYRPTLGVKHPRALGLPVRDVWSEFWEDVLRPLLEGVLRTGEAFWASDHPFFIERHGYPEETYFDISYDPVRDESGRVGGVFCIVSEMTGRVVGERRLRLLRDLGRIASEARNVGAVFEQAGAALAGNTHDLAFALILDASGAPLSGHGPAASWPLPGDGHSELILQGEALGALPPLPGGPWPEPAGGVAVLPIAVPPQPPYGYVVAGLSARLPFDAAYLDFLRLVAQNIAGAVVAAHALEQERARAEALAELDRAKTAFFSNISHEFRTPLTLMLGPLEELLAGATLAAAVRGHLESVHRNSLRLLKLVNMLLDFARIEAGRANARYAPVDLARLTIDLASNFRSACEKAGLLLVVDCPPLPERVWVDAQMWERIVLNLLSNAFKFTFTGRIEVQLRAAGPRAKLRVRDTGVGIAADDLPHVFERFHRVEGTQARTHEGSGIGLALVRELVQLHGGDVHAASEPGQGSTFTVALPFGSDHLPADHLHPEGPLSTQTQVRAYVEEALGWLRATPARHTQQAGPASAHVLVVDDNADMREHLMRVLSERWRVTAVADGAAALAALARERFDLVLTDVMMPRMDGFALLRALKAEPATAQLPVIMLSARAGEEARVDGLAAGVDDYVVKPFSAAQLIAQVQAQLTVQRARRESARERERLLAQEQAARREAQSQREEMARLRREAEAANRAKDQFLAMLGHELRNPLAPVVTALRLLRLRGHQSAELDILERQAGHLTRLVDDLLDVSRITRGKVELRKCRLEIAQAVDKALEVAHPLLEQNRQSVDTQGVARAGLAVEADPHRLAQIIANLLTNAAKYSDPGQHITLRGERVGERVTLAVRDHGFGIAPDMLERIFDVFIQQPQTKGRAAGGLGVGLAIARNLAQLHGGRLDARSDGVGKGSEFVLELPAAGAASALPAPPAEEMPAAGEGKRVLVVDDNVDAAVTLRELLQLLGHTVQVVHNGAAGLEHAHRFAPDVALIDIGLPDMDGYEVARRLRRRMDEGGPRMLMVAVTGYGLRADRELSAAAGFDFHLVKPIDLAALGAVLGMAAGAAAAAK